MTDCSNVPPGRGWSIRSSRNLSLRVLLGIVLVLASATSSFSGPYLDSAHGNSAYGVSRNRTAGVGYAAGNCAHCHEQHASLNGEPLDSLNPYALFYDFVVTRCNLVCYWCHRGVNAEGQAINFNYPYSVRFGGGTEHYANIREQFCNTDSEFANCGSNHDLGAIRVVIENRWGFGSEPDPCAACHNVHLAQRNWEVEFQDGKLKTAISRPSDHESLWGDDPGERMDSYDYQAPFYGSPGDPNSGPFEPANDSISDGSNMPDYVTFCMDCHEYQQYDPIRGQNVKAIEWGASGDRHGAYPSNTCDQGASFEGTLRPPYDDTTNSNYVLSCTDCHEPHGSKRRLHLIRRWINGELVAEDTGTCDELTDWSAVCERCHDLAPGHEAWGGCDVCHGHNVRFSGAGPCNGEPAF